jgi:tetratricopeptide (TPR) repeat protein
LMLLAKPEEAFAVVKEAEIRAPSSFEVADHAARYSMIVDDLPTTKHYIERLRQLGRGENASQLEGQRLVLLGDFQGAQRLFSLLHDSRDPYLRTIGYQLEASVLAESGRYREAISILNVGIKADLPVGNTADRADKYLALAYLYLKRGQHPECRLAVRKSLDIAYSAERIAEAGSLLSRCGFVSDAKDLQRRFGQTEQFLASRVARWWLNGEILLAEGKAQPAKAELRKAKEADQKLGLLRDYWLQVAIANHEWNEANLEIDRLLEHPGQVWHQPELYPPGMMSELFLLRAKVSCRMGLSDCRQLLSAFLERRRDSDPDLPEVSEAQAMLRGDKPKFP